MEEVTFDRPKKYSVVRELGSGACGRTLLLHDLDLDLEVVAKKYAPIPELDAATRKDFLARFRKEAKILLKATHENVVRVFTYYDYPEAASAYFIMEYVDGANIVDYVKNNPSSCESLFLETIYGFSYLSLKGITHRDIRPQNILVTSTGRVKIIDFGFAKSVKDEAGRLSTEFVKSVTLNWWASRPSDFLVDVYDETTEVYFVGMLLGEVVRSSGIENFRYREVIEKMAEIAREQRLPTFNAVSQLISQIDLGAFSFTPIGVATYREFSRALSESISKINTDTKYKKDLAQIISLLEKLHKSVLLEEHVPDVTKLVSIFLSGSYTYKRLYQFPVELLANFITLLKSLDVQRGELVLSNLSSRLDAIPRYSEMTTDDEIPF